MPSEFPDPEESQELMQVIMDHYVKHHEIVFKKLHFAQDATQKSIEEIRAVHKEIEKSDNTNLIEFKGFDKMWCEIIELFAEEGLSQDDLFKIENIITTIPKDIKNHYDNLCQQDKSFLVLVESLNTAAYEKAQKIVFGVQDKPNPLSGLKREDYIAGTLDQAKKSSDAIGFKINPTIGRAK